MSATFTIALPLPHAATALQGRLTVAEREPQGPSVFILPGSGLSDGDGNDSDIGFAPLAQIAIALGNAGFNSLRFDRRGTGATGGDIASPAEELQDFLAVLDAAETLPELPRPWVVLGLGEAAAWAGLLATRRAEKVDGLILVSPPTGAVGDMFRYRQDAEDALATAPVEKHRAIVQELTDNYAASSPLFMFKPIFEIACPTLAIHGDMDWICPVHCSRQLSAELERRGSGPQDWTYCELTGVDRWLIATQQWRSLAEQLQPHWRIDPAAVDILVDWLSRKFRTE
ncbi:S9 family peptidase [Synechococcus sp. PCC 7336]|uniref:alpha/beta hydrolase family protein n=1 Tax=Synechococcus sp. PCC 7336 TaxID=195250 RepID=UPI00034B8186|nr:alpha/beta fold hydrolase [Synechococcus sp. PCC 7336]